MLMTKNSLIKFCEVVSLFDRKRKHIRGADTSLNPEKRRTKPTGSYTGYFKYVLVLTGIAGFAVANRPLGLMSGIVCPVFPT